MGWDLDANLPPDGHAAGSCLPSCVNRILGNATRVALHSCRSPLPTHVSLRLRIPFYTPDAPALLT